MKKKQYEALAAVAAVIIGLWLAFLITDLTYGSSDDEGDVVIFALATRTRDGGASNSEPTGTQTPSGTPAAYLFFLRSSTPQASRTPTPTPTTPFVKPTKREREATAIPKKEPTATRVIIPTRPATSVPKPTGTNAGEPPPTSAPELQAVYERPAWHSDGTPASGLLSWRGSSADLASLPASMSAGESSQYCESYPDSIYCRLITLFRRPARAE